MTRMSPPAAARAATIALALPLALTLSAALAGPAAALPPAAWDDAAPAHIAVSYAADELHTVAGAKAVAARIRIAADKACGGESNIARTGLHFTDCKADAVNRALADLNAPMVAQALGRTPPPALAAR